jgi:ubiquinone/menaquinone biosynthesis C-methylase UbiE
MASGNRPAWPKRLLWRLWYPALTRLTRDASLSFLNYGYAGPDGDAGPVLSGDDEADRPCIQLYHRVAGGIDLTGCRVLEVSCGHGGGASYLARYRRPASVCGLDRNPQAISLCRRRHRGVANLSFRSGDALDLPFPERAFDAVVNVEASHCYADFPRFLAEVRRVLRPGGSFLYADFRDRGAALDQVHEQVQASGLQRIEHEDISPGVVRGMRLNTARYLELVRRLVPGPLQKPAMSFAGVEGSPIYRELVAGETVYFRYVLRKLGVAGSPTR